MIDLPIRSELERQSLHANTTLEFLPVERHRVSLRLLLLLLGLPRFEAIKVDESKASLTIACLQQRVFYSTIGVPTELTLNLIVLNLRSVFEFVLVTESIYILNFSVHASMVLSENGISGVTKFFLFLSLGLEDILLRFLSPAYLYDSIFHSA